eukprot:7562215-Pyramimonas_sp.AAC.1
MSLPAAGDHSNVFADPRPIGQFPRAQLVSQGGALHSRPRWRRRRPRASNPRYSDWGKIWSDTLKSFGRALSQPEHRQSVFRIFPSAPRT